MTGEPFVEAKNILFLGDSGSHIYSNNGKNHRSVVRDLRSHADYPNLHDLTAIGAHPSMWLPMMVKWENAHLQYALPQTGSPAAKPRFGSDFIVIMRDAHNGLQMTTSRYTGLDHIGPSKSVYTEYNNLNPIRQMCP